MRRSSWIEQRLTRPTRFLRIESLRERMLLFAVLAALVPSLVTAWVSYIQNQSAVTERLERQLEGVAGHSGLNQPDGIHPNAEGVAVIVERITPSVEALIAKAASVN